MPAPIEIWYEALEAEHGLVVRTSFRDKFKMTLYGARRKAQDPDLEPFEIVCPAHAPDELWIVRKSRDG